MPSVCSLELNLDENLDLLAQMVEHLALAALIRYLPPLAGAGTMVSSSQSGGPWLTGVQHYPYMPVSNKTLAPYL